ncbi:MAG: dephospho-CoA kinase [Deltaproteobacteria bacterium]|nr:dephospho-CoA kinase [Deltaproteobacteria bacterium]
MAAADLHFAAGVIALTGGIGSGKSSVARWLRDKVGYAYISADEQVALLLEPDTCGWLRLRDILKPDFFSGDGVLDKARLRRAIFRDADLRSVVERTLHPLVLQKIRDAVREVDKHNLPCLVEVPLLYEAGWQQYFNKVIVVYAAADVCAARIQKRDGAGAEDVNAAINAQMPLKEKILRADYVIDNSERWADTAAQINKLQKELDTLLTIS